MGNLDRWLELCPALLSCTEEAYERSIDRVLPDIQDSLRAFTYFSPEDTRVVILGQDPYHAVDSTGTTKAWGLSFGYNPFYQGKVDSSLLNIADELGVVQRDSNGYITEVNMDTSLESWARQGVLLLNTRLTVEIGQPMSHANKYGYEQAIPELLTNLNKLSNSIVWLMWGAEARKVAEEISPVRPNWAICTSHPCKYSHTSGKHPFTGSMCFHKVNTLLRNLGKEEIKWT